MLPAQVEYWKLRETNRHNLVVEDQGWFNAYEGKRHNLAQEDYWQGSLAETTRHNKAQESYWGGSLRETTRHNIATEKIGMSQVGATYAQIGLGYSQLSETNRHNLEEESIQNTANTNTFLNTASNSTQADSAWQNAQSNAQNAQTNVYRAQTERGQAISSEARGWYNAVEQTYSDIRNANANDVRATADLIDAVK